MLSRLRSRLFRPGIDDSLLGRSIRSAIFPPLLPLLGLLLLLLVTAVWESLHMPSDQHAEPLRWVMFMPLILVVSYGLLFFANLFDAGIQ